MSTPVKYPIYGSNSLRRGRHSQPGRTYLVTTTTHAREPFFTEWSAASAACRSINHAQIWQNSRALSWVLMPDHWHGLIELGEADELSNLIRRVKAVTALQVNRAIERRGPVWQEGFHDHALRADEDVRDAAQYVVNNPVRAGIVENAEQYSFWNSVWI